MAKRVLTTATRRAGGRRAAVYIRQSSGEQVEQNTGSQAYQLSLAQIARDLGYAEDQIEIISDDLGLSGSAAAHRLGYQRLLRGIEQEEFDLVIAADASRISRDGAEWLRLLCLCAVHGVELILDGKRIDPRQGDQRFVTGIIAMTGEYDNWRRQETMERGRQAKLAAGKAVTVPPAGYIKGPDGAWLKDDRPEVQQSIAAHFAAILDVRSLKKAVALLRERGVQTPRRGTAGSVIWRLPTLHALQKMVDNPAYVGDVTYGRRRSDRTRPRDGRGKWRTKKSPPDTVTTVRDHHEPYVSREQWEEIRQLMARNTWSKEHGVLGPADDLLQGVLRCRQHRNWAMRAMNRGKAGYRYFCIGDIFEGGKPCGFIPGWLVEPVVRTAVVDRLGPASIVELRTVLRGAALDAKNEERRRAYALLRLRSEVDDLERRYETVAPDRWAVRDMLEQKLETKKRELIVREREAMTGEGPSQPALDEGCLDELASLCRSLDALLDAPTTAARDRKELVRILVERVLVEERTKERILLRIVWRDGAPDSVLTVLLWGYAHRVAAEMDAVGAPADEIAERLRRERVTTKARTSWTAGAVRRYLARVRREAITREGGLRLGKAADGSRVLLTTHCRLADAAVRGRVSGEETEGSGETVSGS